MNSTTTEALGLCESAVLAGDHCVLPEEECLALPPPPASECTSRDDTPPQVPPQKPAGTSREDACPRVPLQQQQCRQQCSSSVSVVVVSEASRGPSIDESPRGLMESISQSSVNSCIMVTVCHSSANSCKAFSAQAFQLDRHLLDRQFRWTKESSSLVSGLGMQASLPDIRHTTTTTTTTTTFFFWV